MLLDLPSESSQASSFFGEIPFQTHQTWGWHGSSKGRMSSGQSHRCNRAFSFLASLRSSPLGGLLKLRSSFLVPISNSRRWRGRSFHLQFRWASSLLLRMSFSPRNVQPKASSNSCRWRMWFLPSGGISRNQMSSDHLSDWFQGSSCSEWSRSFP